LNSSITHNDKHHINDRTTASSSLKKTKGFSIIMHELTEQELEQVVGCGTEIANSLATGSARCGYVENFANVDVFTDPILHAKSGTQAGGRGVQTFDSSSTTYI
jgi:hypothetical protein